jgi:hypothetical protein
MNKTRVRLVEIDQAQGEVKGAFEEMEKIRGGVTPLFKGYAIFPELMKANWQLMKAVYGGGSLSRKLKDSIIIALAEYSQCTY